MKQLAGCRNYIWNVKRGSRDMKPHNNPVAKWVLACHFVLAPSSIFAQDLYWVCGNEWWDSLNETCWSTTQGGAGTVQQPQAGDNAILIQDGATDITVSYWNTDYPTAVLNNVDIDATGTGRITLEYDTDHNLSTTNEYVGLYGYGAVNQTNGIHTITNELVLGGFGGSNGTFNLSGTGNLVVSNAGTANEFIGLAGVGSFTQSGGIHDVDNLYLGENTGSEGYYTLSNGGLNVLDLHIGNSGYGEFIQSGGDVSIFYELHLGTNVDGNGIYTLSGGTLDIQGGGIANGAGVSTLNLNGGILTADFSIDVDDLYVGSTTGTSGVHTMATGDAIHVFENEYIGYEGTGSFTQNDGTHEIDNNLYLGFSYTDPGDYGEGTYTLNGGNLYISGELYVGYDGVGTFIQSGGYNAVTSNLHLGNGTYTLSGGTLSICDGGIVNGTGTGVINLDGGLLGVGCTAPSTSFDVDYLFLGSAEDTNGSYELDATGVLTADGEYIGSRGVGVFNQTGGVNNVTNLVLGQFDTGDGTYNLADGDLQVSGIMRVGSSGSGVFNQHGGSHSITNDLSLGTNSGSDGTYTLLGGALDVGGNIVNGAGAGTLNLDGGALTVGGGNIDVDTVVLGSELSTFGTYEHTALVSLIAGDEIIGKFGDGEFIQSSGLHTITGNLTLGENIGSQGSYTLSAGDLDVGGNILNGAGTGTLNINGGALTVGGSIDVDNLVLGSEASTSGTYEHTGPGSLNAGEETIGKAGDGFFTQSGGAHNVTGNLTLGENYTSSLAIYTLTDGTLNVGGDIIRGEGGHSRLELDGGTLIVGGGDGSINIGNLILGAVSLNTGTHTLSGSGSITTLYTGVGLNGVGDLIQLGGTHNVDVLDVGRFEQSQGVYTLVDGDLQVTGFVRVGEDGSGEFNQSGGAHTITGTPLITGDLFLGVNSGSYGTYTLSGGTMDIAGSIVNGAGTGTLNIDGGTLTVGGSIDVDSLVLGSEAGTSGTYEYAGPGSLTAGEETIGKAGDGFLTQSGGTHNVTGNLFLGENSGSNGTYTLSGGTLDVGGGIEGAGMGILKLDGGTLTVGSGNGSIEVDYLYLGSASGTNGVHELSGTGSLYVEADEYIGYEGDGTFTQTDGSHTVDSDLYLGTNVGTRGTYTLSGGTLNIYGNLVNGEGTGTFNLDNDALTVGGNINVDRLVLGSQAGTTGSHTLSGTASLIAGDEFIGEIGSGHFMQSGGNHEVTTDLSLGFSYIDQNNYGYGTYDLIGGNLTSQFLTIGHEGVGEFTQTGGTHNVNDTLSLGRFNTGVGTYNLSGPGTLTVNGSERIGDNGSGQFTQTDGDHTVASNLYLGYSYTDQDNYGQGTYTLNNGDLSSNNEYVGLDGIGDFVQTGGNNSVTNQLLLSSGLSGKGQGSYRLEGGDLEANQVLIGVTNAGSFTQSGGIHTVNNSLVVGSTSNYSMSNGSLWVGDTEVMLGTFDQTGGAHEVVNTLYLGDPDFQNSTYNLTGGTLHAGSIVRDSTNGVFSFNAGTLLIDNDLLVDPTGLLGNSFTITGLHTLGVGSTTTLAGAGTLTLDGGTFSTGSLVDNGGFTFNSGNFNLTSDNLDIGTIGNTLFGRRAVFDYGKEVNVTNNVFIEQGATLSMRGGIITANGISNDGVIEMADPLSEVGGSVVANSGLLYGSGTINSYFINGVSGEVRADLGETLTFTGSALGAVDNPGRITLLGGALDFTQGLNNDGQVSGRGTIIVGPAASLVNSDRMVFSGTTDLIGDVNNATGGSIIISGSSTATFHDNVTHNGSEIRVSEGSMAVFFGNVTGTGPYTGDGTVFFEGTLIPGSSPGLVSIEGDMGLGDSSHTIMEIAGLDRGTEYDAFDIGDSLWLDGELEVSLYALGDGLFAPQLGDSFDLFAAETISGEFDLLTLAFLGNGLGWQLDVVADAMGLTDVVRLSVVTSAVPVPPSVWLFGSGLLGLIAVSRQRRVA